MGAFMGKAMDESMQKNQDFMVENQRVMLERQMHMQNQMRERMVAVQIAKTRELFAWLASFYLIASIGMIRGYSVSKKPSVLAPLLPLTFIVAYNGDLAYGTKMNRIKAEAENILMFEKDVLDTP